MRDAVQERFILSFQSWVNSISQIKGGEKRTEAGWDEITRSLLFLFFAAALEFLIVDNSVGRQLDSYERERERECVCVCVY